MKQKVLLATAIASILLFTSCKNNSSRFKIDTQKEHYNVKIHRFDRDMLSLNVALIRPGVNELYKHYPEFTNEFVSQILGLNAKDTAKVAELFSQYLSNKTYAPANKKAKELYRNISDIETKVSNAYSYIHHYFPEIKLPEIYFFVSGFNRQVLMTDRFIGVGIDFYLGNNFPMYPKLTYRYMIYNMRRENLATDLVSATLFRMFTKDSKENRLLDNMIFRGKVMYLLSVFMPEEQPEILMGYSPEQWQWSVKFEQKAWMAIIDQKHLFSTDVQLINKYMNDAPFTTPISQESPGRLGTFIGWQIVKSYMEKNKEKSLRDLMNENNYQRLLEESGYHP